MQFRLLERWVRVQIDPLTLDEHLKTHRNIQELLVSAHGMPCGQRLSWVASSGNPGERIRRFPDGRRRLPAAASLVTHAGRPWRPRPRPWGVTAFVSGSTAVIAEVFLPAGSPHRYGSSESSSGLLLHSQ